MSNVSTWKQTATLVDSSWRGHALHRMQGDLDELIQHAFDHLRYRKWERLNVIEKSLAGISVGVYAVVSEASGIKVL